MKTILDTCQRAVLAALTLAASISTAVRAEERVLHSFERKQLTDVYYSEGANAGDIDGDGQADVVYGPYWFEGPAFEKKHELYPARPQNREGYADNFFNWIYDFNGDGWNDVFVVGFPGTPAYVYECPKAGGYDKPWKKHTVFESVANESPHFTNLVGDKRPELVCTFKGSFGFATIDWDKPFETWEFHRVSDQSAPDIFGHGLGVGDINGDGLNDIITVAGWFEQPKEAATTGPWPFHAQAFSNAYGGAEMYAYDVDGDGDNDVITSLAAHDFGLAWYEQDRSGPEPVFRQHLIMGDRPSQNRYGLVFSELHSLALVDIDGDGLKDIVTGKTYYSHHKQSPMWDAGAVVYWFRLTRTDKGVDWIPYLADAQAGIGRQVSVVDVNGDTLPDIVLGGMLGAHVLTHRKQTVDETQWQKAQPKPVQNAADKTPRGVRPAISAVTGRVDGCQEGEQLKILRISAGQTAIQNMDGFTKDRWSDAKQLFWTGGKPGEQLELEFQVEGDGSFEILAAFTMARDYGIIDLDVDGQSQHKGIDLYNYPDVISTGELNLGTRKFDAGPHKLTVIIAGANPAAVKAYMVGLDYLRLQPARSK
jgi:hypothetical protein